MLFGEGSSQRRHIADCLLAPEGLCVAVCDELSVFNRATIATDAWASTAPSSHDRLFEYNAFMCDEMSSARAVVWILLLWGVFRLRVELHERLDEMPSRDSSSPLIGNGKEASINVPSGRLGWMDVDGTPNSWRELARIPPGSYLCRLSGNEHPNHWGLKDPAQYPPDDEDWVLHLVPVAVD
jgi:hypothetical protein